MKLLGTFGMSFTNNGLALSPDGTAAFVTLIGHPLQRNSALKIERIDVASLERSFVADGEEPAVSPNGTLLAFISGGFDPEEIAVKSLTSDATRTIDLRPLLGRSILFESSLAWTADGSDVVALAGAVTINVSGDTSVAAAAPGKRRCGSASSTTCLVVVHVPRTGRRLTARIVVAHTPGGNGTMISEDGELPNAVRLSRLLGTRTVIDQLVLSGGRTAHVTSAITLRGSRVCTAEGQPGSPGVISPLS